MRKIITLAAIVASLASLSFSQSVFAKNLGAATITDPWNVVKVGQHVKGMKVTNVASGPVGGLGVTLEGKKVVSGVVTCFAEQVDGWDSCTIEFGKASQRLLPWGIKNAVISNACVTDSDLNLCDDGGPTDGRFAPGKQYRVRIQISKITDSSCTGDCDFVGATITPSRILTKVELKK